MQACAYFLRCVISLQGKYLYWYHEMISNWNLVKWSYVICETIPTGISHPFSTSAIPLMASPFSILCWWLYGEGYCKDLCCGLHVSYTVLACSKPVTCLIQVRIHGHPRDIEWHLVFLGELKMPRLDITPAWGDCLLQIWYDICL